MSFKLFFLLSRSLAGWLSLYRTLAAVASACCLNKFLKYFRCRWQYTRRHQAQCHGTCYVVYKGPQQIESNCLRQVLPVANFVLCCILCSAIVNVSFSFQCLIQLNLKVRERHFTWLCLKRLI